MFLTLHTDFMKSRILLESPSIRFDSSAYSIPKSDRTSIHKNLFIALICAQVILLCSGSAIHNKVTQHPPAFRTFNQWLLLQ